MPRLFVGGSRLRNAVLILGILTTLVAAFAVSSSVSMGAGIGSPAAHATPAPALRLAAGPGGLGVDHFNVTFIETGLTSTAGSVNAPTGWTVTFNKTATTSHTIRDNFTVENGTFNTTNGNAFTVTAIAGYAATPGSGNVTVVGANVTIYIQFVQWHTITFVETGLPATSPGQVWGIYIANDIDSSLSNNSGTAPFEVVWTLNNTFNGTAPGALPSAGYPYYGNYTYSVVPVPGYDSVVTPAVGTPCGENATGVMWCNVTQGDADVAVAFHSSPYYTVQFNETGLAAGTAWSVTFNGNTIISTTASIDFGTQNGSYSYSIGGGGTVVVAPATAPVNESNPSSGTLTAPSLVTCGTAAAVTSGGCTSNVTFETYQNISFFPFSPISISTAFTTAFTTNGFAYFALPYNITWSVSLTNATMLAENGVTMGLALQQQLNITVLQPNGCGPEPFQHPCLTVWTTVVPFSFHTDLTATSANFYFDLTAANLTGSTPTSITGPCPFGSFGCGNPYVGEILPQNEWEISVWTNWDNGTAYNNSNAVTAHIGFMVVTSPYPQISSPIGNVTEGVVTVSGNFSGYFVTGAVVTITNSTGFTVLTQPVYAPGVTSHAYQVTWHAQVPGVYTIALNLSTPWFEFYTATETVTVLPGVPLTYVNSTGLTIAGLGAGGSGALLIIVGAIIGMIVMALVARGLWGSKKPEAAQPWSPAASETKEGSTDTTMGGGGSGGGTMDTGMGGTGGSGGGMSGGSGGMGGSSPPS
jgi:hypothetical protein